MYKRELTIEDMNWNKMENSPQKILMDCHQFKVLKTVEML